jgi:imidazolonepropionase-like amidohydrolase
MSEERGRGQPKFEPTGLMDTPMAVDTRARASNPSRAEVAAERDAKVPLGAILSPTGGHGQTYGYRHDVCACVQSTSGICDGVDECRRAVRRQVSHGADAIKFVATGGVLSNIKAGLDQQFSDD